MLIFLTVLTSLISIALTFRAVPKRPLFCNTTLPPKIFQLNADIDCGGSISSANDPKWPLFCNTTLPPKIFQLNADIDIDCGGSISSANEGKMSSKSANATLYKLNLSKYSTEAWSCQKLIRTLVVYKGIDHTHVLQDTVQTLPTNFRDCQLTKETKTCHTTRDQNRNYNKNNNDNSANKIGDKDGGVGDEAKQLYKMDGDVWSTNLSAIIHAKLFQTKAYNVTNCFLTKSEVWINRLTNSLESSHGVVNHCRYIDGRCELSDNRALIWYPDNESKCAYLPYRTIAGIYDSESGIFRSRLDNSDSEPVVLTFSKDGPIAMQNDSCGNEFYRSDQGVGVVLEFGFHRRKRAANGDSGYDPVTQGEMNMKLQGIVGNLLQSPDVNGQSLACAMAREMSDGWRDDAAVNPTMVVRRLTRNSAVKAELRGRAVFVWSCVPVDEFRILPMEGVCSREIPMVFNLTTESDLFGYLNAFSNEIQPTSTAVNCDNIQSPTVLELHDKTFLYDYKTGLLDSSKLPDFPTISLDQLKSAKNASDNRLNSIIYRSNSMYSRKEYLHYIDLNDLHKNADVEAEKKKILQESLSKYSKDGVLASTKNLSDSIGDILSHLGGWWSYLYWFAVGAGALLAVFVSIKLLCFCNAVLGCLTCCDVDKPSAKIIRRKRRKIYYTKNGETFV